MADTEAVATETEDQATESQVEETSTESQTDETAAPETEESTDETEADEGETPEEAAESDETEDSQTDEKPQKTRQDYIEERIARREAKRLREGQNDFRSSMEETGWEQPVQSIENGRVIEKVENNIPAAQNDIATAQNMPVFKEDPALFNDLMHETLEKYGVWHEELKEPNGDPVFLGFYDPKTGSPISIKNIAQREANRLERIAERVRTAAKVEAAKGEAKMRASAEAPHTGGKNTATDFDDMSPAEKAEYLRAKGHEF